MTYDGFDVYSEVDQHMTPLAMRTDLDNRPPFFPAYHEAIRAIDKLKEKLIQMERDRCATLMNRAFDEAKARPDYKGQSIRAETYDGGNTYVGEFVPPPEDWP